MRSLFIYVPTYRRAALLRRQLDSLQSQIQEYPNVRVLVSDNDEPNEDMERIRLWCESTPQFSFRRNPGNIGANANMALGFCLSSPDDVLWILADDTTVLPGALEKVLAVIDSDADIYAFSREDVPPVTGHFNLSEEGIGYALANYPWGLISSVLYDMRTMRYSVRRAFTLHNSSFPHLAVLFDAAAGKGQLAIHWLSEREMIAEGAPATSEYSESLTGMPQLFSLAPHWERASLSRRWTRQYGGSFYRNQSVEPTNFIMTRALLLNFGGVPERILLAAGRMEWLLKRGKFGTRLAALAQRNALIMRLLGRP